MASKRTSLSRKKRRKKLPRTVSDGLMRLAVKRSDIYFTLRPILTQMQSKFACVGDDGHYYEHQTAIGAVRKACREENA